MDFTALRTQVIELLQCEGRVAYRVLKLQFQLDDDLLEALKDDLIYAKKLAVDEDGRVLVWTGGTSSAPPPASSVPLPATPDVSPAQVEVAPAVPPPPREAERRQLTVLFCDLVESTALSTQLDPEDLREVIRAYQTTCAEVIQRFEGHIAQYLGDGLLVYFGYPQAHEDDAQRAVQSGLGMVHAMGTLNTRLEHAHGIRLAVRVGIHTGLVVVGPMGADRQEQLAVGETPNMAARVQGLTAPDTVVISEATARLVQGYFTWEALGLHTLRGVPAPLQLYRVLQESGAQSRLDATMGRGLTPLVGREAVVTRLLEGWQQVQDSLGHMVLLSGEAGIGKSRLVQVLKDRAGGESSRIIECRCLPYDQHSALAPVIAYLQQALGLHREDAPAEKLRKLEGAMAQHPWPLAEVVPLFAALLSIPLPAQESPRLLTPQQQRQQTLQALLAWLLTEAAQQPVLFIMEDLHWIDPSTVEFLSLVVDHGSTARLYSLFTFRPTFTPPWAPRAHLISMGLSPLSPSETVDMVERVAGGKTLPAEVQQQIVAKTDGVPLAVEELTKMLLESGVLQEQEEGYALTGPLPPLAIPATLHDALMARLDRLAPVKAVAQLGATIGRTFPYDLLQAVAPFAEATLQTGLRQLVEAELLSQCGVPPQATYLFKHALIQEAAYQSLLRSTRQQYHQRIAQVLETQFPESATTQPELLAQHYTEAGLREQAIAYWQRAGQRAVEHSAHLEAISHFTHGLELLTALPDTPQRAQHELTLRIAVGTPLIATRGYPAPDVAQTYSRALELCQHIGATPQLLQATAGLFAFYLTRGELRTAQQLSARVLRLAQEAQAPDFSPEAHTGEGMVAYYLGDLAAAREHCEHGLALYPLAPPRSRAVLYQDPRAVCLLHAAFTLWSLGYPDQALTRHNEALAVAQQVSQPITLLWTLDNAVRFQQFRREAPRLTQEQAEATMAVAAEHGFPLVIATCTLLRGWAMVVQGQSEEGLAQMRQGWAAWRTIGAGLWASYWLGLLAEAYGHGGQREEGLALLAEALAIVDDTGQRFYAAELYRLKGELQLGHAVYDEQQAETCLRQALEIARQQQAKSWELRTAMSLARLWQQQGKRQEAHDLLAPVYGWFTEGFDTADLQEAQALLDALA
jgi:class 3 adenylate cyclase/predicted ATPase